MLRYLFAFIIFIHGLIHLIGFTKGLQLAPVEETRGETLLRDSGHWSKAIGMVWFVTCVLFVLSVVMFLLKKESWWIVGTVALLLSQLLIIQNWHYFDCNTKNRFYGTRTNRAAGEQTSKSK